VTTNVFDGISGVVAADTRWSTLTSSNWMIYIDEPNYPKLVIKEIGGDKYGFLFAGDGVAIQNWKNWLSSNQTTARPSALSMAICIVDLMQRKHIYHEGQEYLAVDALSITGSGALHALTCWMTNKCAKKAINSASMRDIHTGNYVQFYEMGTSEHNLPEQNNMTIDDVRKTMAIRGYIMNKEIGKDSIIAISSIDSINSISANDVEEIKNIRNGLLHANISPTAPCIGVYNTRSEEQENALDNALSSIFQKNISRN
jgi:hypothetical protein